jgi:hypothetical protein
MVDVLMLDLGGTLVDGAHPFPHVLEALAALRRFSGTSGRPLELAVVSDFLPADPPTPAGVKARLAEYLAILDGVGLRRAFQPATRRVTLSTQAGVAKPDRRVYELALRRLDCGAALADCLSITEDGAHVAACRALGMQALRFGGDFTDWSEAPLLVRHVVDPASGPNTALALAVWLAARHGRKLAGLDGAPTPAGANLRVRPPGPTRASVAFDPAGRVARLEWADGPG